MRAGAALAEGSVPVTVLDSPPVTPIFQRQGKRFPQS